MTGHRDTTAGPDASRPTSPTGTRILPLALVLGLAACGGPQSMSNATPLSTPSAENFPPDKEGFTRLRRGQIAEAVAGTRLQVISVLNEGVPDANMSFSADGHWSESVMSLVSEVSQGRWSSADDRLCIVPTGKAEKCGELWVNPSRKIYVIKYYSGSPAEITRMYSVSKVTL